MELNRLHPAIHVRMDRGFTLIEALIALFVFSVALLGIAALLARSVSVSHSAYLRSVASIQAMDMAERIRANVLASGSEYDDLECDELPAGATNCSTSTCNAAQLAAWDHVQWCNDTSSRFGGLFKSAEVDLDGTDYLISIIWQERTVTDDNQQDIVATEDSDGNALFTWRVSP